MNNSNNKNYRQALDELLRQLTAKPIAYNADLARIFGDPNQAILFQQLQYWSDKGKREDGWIYKSKKEIEQETALSEYRQDTARKKLENDHKVIETKIKKANGVPTLHYRIKVGNLEKAVLEYLENLDSETRKNQDSITKSTQRVQQIEASKSDSRPEEDYNGEYELESEEDMYDQFGNRKKKQKLADVSKSEETNKAIERIWTRWSTMCVKELGTKPKKTRKAKVRIRKALNSGGLTEEQIYDLFDEWIIKEKPAEKLIHITYALSDHNIDEFKAMYGL